MASNMAFLKKFLKGEASPVEVNNFMATLINADGSMKPMHEALGMSEAEYWENVKDVNTVEVAKKMQLPGYEN